MKRCGASAPTAGTHPKPRAPRATPQKYPLPHHRRCTPPANRTTTRRKATGAPHGTSESTPPTPHRQKQPPAASAATDGRGKLAADEALGEVALELVDLDALLLHRV